MKKITIITLCICASLASAGFLLKSTPEHTVAVAAKADAPKASTGYTETNQAAWN